MTMVDNSMISFERRGEDFERFLDDDGRQFDDFLRMWKRRFREIPRSRGREFDDFLGT